MKNILLKIANLLYINMQYMNSYGLLKGKMGAALFFYEYSRYSDNDVYNDYADRILDDILDAISNKKVCDSSDLNDGLGGIGWGIQYLINHKFVEGEADEVLIDFDKKIQESIDGLKNIPTLEWSKFIAENEFFLGLDTYVLSRSKESIYNFENLQKIVDFYFSILKGGQTFSMQFLNTCYSFLLFNYTKMEGKHTLFFKDKLKEAYLKSINEKRYLYSDIKVLHRLLKQKEYFLNIDHPKLDVEQDISLLKNIDLYLNTFKVELLSIDNDYQLLDETVVNKYLDELMKDIPSANLTLGQGLTGVGLSILKAIK